MGTPIDVSGLGKLSIAPDPKAPLLVVFGGINVDQSILDGMHHDKPVAVPSGVYMWNYMSGIQDRYHVFVAVNNHVDGNNAYDKLMAKLDDQSLDPDSQILYLFSGGYGPGMRLLTHKGVTPFSEIYLVDIWMGVGKPPNPVVPDFYKHLVNKHEDMITYVYTSFGANNPAVRDYIANKLGDSATLVEGHKGEGGMQTHMRTNIVAIDMLD